MGVFAFALWLQKQFGPGYYACNWDPQYTYLMNSASMAQGRTITHFWHPGTTVNMVGSVIVRLLYTLGDFKNLSMDKAILTQPEWFLHWMTIIYDIIKTGLLWLLGITVLNKWKSIWLAFLFQLTPLFALDVVRFGYTQVTPESFVFMVIILLLIYMVKTWDTEEIYTIAIVHGIIGGLGMASKLIYAPLLLIPFFIISKTRLKLVYVITFIISFLILLIPVFNLKNFETSFYVFGWDIFAHKGHYGFGSNQNGWKIFTDNIAQIVRFNALFSLLYIVIPVYLIWQRLSENKQVDEKHKTNILLLCLFIIETITLFYVGKSYRDRYLTAGLTLGGLAFILLLWSAGGFKMFKSGFFVALILVGINTAFTFGLDYLPKQLINESKDIDILVKTKYKNFGRVYYLNSSSVPFAFYYSRFYAEKYYDNLLNELYPDDYMVHIHDKGAIYHYTYGDTIQVGDILKKYQGKVILIGTPIDHYFDLLPELNETIHRKRIGFPVCKKADIFNGRKITIYTISQ
ncbi:MAG TPA: hypothetical protein VG603_15885 [Chitinophagales bacterium]|nr:hypothetical protein [Chitinophagales bacterium]